MDNHLSAENRLLRIPPIGWLLGVCLTAVLIAIFIFNVPVKTAATYGFLVLIFGAKLLMHAAIHGGYQQGTTSNTSQSDTTEHPRYIGGCH